MDERKTWIKKLLLLTVLITSISGCFKDSAPDSNNFDIGSFQDSCKINTERLKKMLELDVTADIDCIENNLKQFANFVKRDDPNVIEKAQLERFITKFFPKEASDIKKSLQFLFQIDSLILRDHSDKITVSNIKNIFDLVRAANRYGAPLNKIFIKLNEKKENYWNLRNQVEFLFNGLTKEIVTITGRVSGPTISINIMNFLRDLKSSMGLKEDQLDLELIENFLYVKKLLIGGDKGVLSTDEFNSIVPRVGELALLAFDFIYMKDLHMELDKEKDLFFLGRLKKLKALLHPWADDEHILSHNDLIASVGKILEGRADFSIKRAEEGIQNIKIKIIGGGPDVYTFGNIMKGLNLGQELFERWYFNDVTYEHFKATMDKDAPITQLERPELPEYKELSRHSVFSMWKEFHYIATHYRLFHAPEAIQYYTNEYRRQLYGFNLQAVIRFGLGLALDVYGHPVVDPITKKPLFMAATIDELRLLLDDVKTIMEELKLWPHFYDRFLSEAMNSSDLFQFQSNGDGVIALNEASEYVANILSSTTLAIDAFAALKKHCPVIDNDPIFDEGIEVACYREHFFETLFKDLNYKRYFQKLYDYYTFYSASELMNYLQNVESFAKERRGDDIPMTKIDIGRMFVSLSNVESTFIRFDKDHTNILTYSEINQGWPRFKQTVMGFAKLKASQDKIGHSIFIYLVKKMKEPSLVEALAFHLAGRKKDIKARRMNIGAILAMVAKATIPSK